MRTILSTIVAALLACTALATAPAHAQQESVSYYDATAGGCTARFMHRVDRNPIAGQGSAGYVYGIWIKVADTCGGGWNDTSNFAAFGFCTVGPFNDASPCSVHGQMYRRWMEHANCSRELLSQVGGDVATGDPGDACIGTPIY